MAVKPIPEGYHTVTPYLTVQGADQVIKFLENAFGARERMRLPGPGGTVGHAEIEIGDSLIMIADVDERGILGELSPAERVGERKRGSGGGARGEGDEVVGPQR